MAVISTGGAIFQPRPGVIVWKYVVICQPSQLAASYPAMKINLVYLKAAISLMAGSPMSANTSSSMSPTKRNQQKAKCNVGVKWRRRREAQQSYSDYGGLYQCWPCRKWRNDGVKRNEKRRNQRKWPCRNVKITCETSALSQPCKWSWKRREITASQWLFSGRESWRVSAWPARKSSFSENIEMKAINEILKMVSEESWMKISA